MNRNNKNVVRLTESKLRNMIKESVTDILKEGLFDTTKAMWDGAKQSKIRNSAVKLHRRQGDRAREGYDNIAYHFAYQIEDFAKKKDLDVKKLGQYVIYALQSEIGVERKNATPPPTIYSDYDIKF